MVPRSFSYAAPKTIRETTALLKEYGGNARILAGGMSLVPVMKLRLASPTRIVDINRVSGLDYIRERNRTLLIGALTRHHTLETSDLVKRRVPLVAETASWIGDPQVRNRGTIGGSLSHSDPSGDWGAAMLALRGRMMVRAAGRQRVLKSDEFFVDTFTSAVKPTEVLVEIAVPVAQRKSGGSYQKLERKAGDFATVGVAAQLQMDDKGSCEYVGIGLTAVGPTNLRAKKAEKSLLGRDLSDRSIEEASAAAAEDARPSADPLRGSIEYRKEMVNVFTRRALTVALGRAKGAK